MVFILRLGGVDRTSRSILTRCFHRFCTCLSDLDRDFQRPADTRISECCARQHGGQVEGERWKGTNQCDVPRHYYHTGPKNKRRSHPRSTLNGPTCWGVSRPLGRSEHKGENGRFIWSPANKTPTTIQMQHPVNFESRYPASDSSNWAGRVNPGQTKRRSRKTHIFGVRFRPPLAN